MFVKRPYETVVVFDGTLPEDTLAKEQSKVQSLIQEHAEFEKIDAWGRREMTYEIRKKKAGYYCVYYYLGDGPVAGKIERGLRLNENVLRFLSVVRNTKMDGIGPGHPAVKAVAAPEPEREVESAR
jgi:small subunit ribosomal protein S6